MHVIKLGTVSANMKKTLNLDLFLTEFANILVFIENEWDMRFRKKRLNHCDENLQSTLEYFVGFLEEVVIK